MNPDRLLAHFDRLADAPDAILRLRRFILELAVRGKLIEPDLNDEPASELLRRIAAERAQLVSEGRTRKQPDLPPPDLSCIPFAIPKHWTWIELRNLGSISGGMTPSKSRSEFWNGRINWFSPKDIKSDDLTNSEIKITDIGVSETGLQLYPSGCLFMVARSGILKRTFPVAINRVEATANQDLKILSPFIKGLERYLQIMFRGMTDFILSELVKTGTTVQSLKYDEFEAQPFPLPPLAEQHRIVAKVDELMALCNRFEAARNERESRRDRLAATSLHHLGQLPEKDGADAFRANARFYFNHLPRLTTRPDHIKQLRQTILDLAVRGKLVNQEGDEGAIIALLDRIDAERSATAKIDLRADARLKTVLAAELRWEAPNTWAWRCVGDLALFIDYRGKTPPKTESGIRLITAKNVRRGYVSLQPEEYISRSTYRSWMTLGLPRIGDVLFTTEAPIGNAAVLRLPETVGLAQRVINFRLYGKLDPDFFVLQILAKPFQDILDATATGLTAKGIKAAKLKRLPIAIPPLGEQLRIVAKVHEYTS
jgi:type I restriction enzyme, S subunit